MYAGVPGSMRWLLLTISTLQAGCLVGYDATSALSNSAAESPPVPRSGDGGASSAPDADAGEDADGRDTVGRDRGDTDEDASDDGDGRSGRGEDSPDSLDEAADTMDGEQAACPAVCSTCQGDTCVIDCAGGGCNAASISCPSDRNCSIRCPGSGDCDDAELHCPDANGCELLCGGGDGDACDDSRLHCPGQDAACNVTCDEADGASNFSCFTLDVRCGMGECSLNCLNVVANPAPELTPDECGPSRACVTHPSCLD